MTDSNEDVEEEKRMNGLVSDSPKAMSEIADANSEHEEGNAGSYASSGGEGEDSVDEEEDDDEEDEEEEEPALKYERLGSVHDLLQKDSASALTYANQRLVLGTHAGIIHVLDLSGQRIKSVKPHSASIIDISVDETADFIGTASMDGQVVIHSLTTSEVYSFDMKRPMRTIALEPNFAKKSTRAFTCGGMAGNLVMHEKGWLGHRETLLHSGEGPIWQVRWKSRFIAWANDLGVKIYDTVSQMRIIFIDRPADSPRADLFKCTLHWQDDSTLLIGWADQIKVARIRTRPRSNVNAPANQPPFIVEITAVFQLDCMISGIVPHPLNPTSSNSIPVAGDTSSKASAVAVTSPVLTSFLVIAYTPPDTSFLSGNEAASSRAEQARKAAERPELRIISRSGEELAADALSISGYERWGCNDYILVDIPSSTTQKCPYYIVLSPKDVVVVKPRDWRDHVSWLVERQQYEEALEEIERHQNVGENITVEGDSGIDAVEIGQKYIEHLVHEGEYGKAARLCPKVCGQDAKRWEDWIYVFIHHHQLQAIIPYIPTESPTLSHPVYEMALAHFLSHDPPALLTTIKIWPRGIYDIPTVIEAVQAKLDRRPSSSTGRPATPTSPEAVILMECLAELYTANRQPGKALPYFIRLRRPNVFDLIRENNLFTAVQDQALLLVEFDHELMEKRKTEQGESDIQAGPGAAITLLVDHVHSIPIEKVVQQLQSRPYYLYLYLDALFAKDSHLTSDFADSQVKLYAEYAPAKLIDFLRASNYYSLERAYNVCNDRDLVPEMVFLLGRMGNNKKALTLIIERLADVNRAIDFAKEQHDDDLWEDLLRYSESRPTFIRGLLENVGAEIDPIRLIRRIKNGLEIPGLKGALIKILQDFNLQMSLLEGCQTILNGDCAELASRLYRDQTSGFFLNVKAVCPICTLPLVQAPQRLLLLFLCRHVIHATCVARAEQLPQYDEPLISLDGSGKPDISARIALTSLIRARIDANCPACRKKGEGERT